MSKHKLNIHYRGSPWGSRTQQQAYCLRLNAHSQHIESHLGKKQPQAKIPIAFLFSQLHFNNVTSHALFFGGHLVMHSKRCAMQNQGITLRDDATHAHFLTDFLSILFDYYFIKWMWLFVYMTVPLAGFLWVNVSFDWCDTCDIWGVTYKESV